MRRIKPHNPLLVRAPVNSFEFQSCDRTPPPGGILIVLTAARKGSVPPTPSIHRLQRGLPGYHILFAPHAFAPQRQLSSSRPPSPLVFLLISTHFTATLGIPPASPILKGNSFKSSFRVKPEISLLTCCSAYTPFTPSKSGQRLPPTYYRGCWHVVSRGFFSRYRHVLRPW